jgi:hypothetical protein
MKRITLLLIAFLPLLIGCIQAYLAMRFFHDGMAFYYIVNIGMLITWFFAGYFSRKLIKSKIESLVWLNSIAFLMLIPIFVQEFILREHWMMYVSFIFYLPVAYFPTYAFSGGNMFRQISFFSVSVAALASLLLASYFGATFYEKRN